MIKQFIGVALMMAAQHVIAQPLAEAKKMLYYERYAAAKKTLKEAIAQTPQETELYYWLSQAGLEGKDTAAARQALLEVQKLAQENAKLKTDPLVEAGWVHLLVAEGKQDEAYARSEALVKDTRGKNAAVLIALAKAQTTSEKGNYDYALTLLDKAIRRDKNNPEIFALMGDAWRRKGDGGKAVSNYMAAVQADPSYARAHYSIGRVYLTQNNQSMYVKYFMDAVQQDSLYAPALYDLYYHYYYRDVNEAKRFLEKYIAHTDPSVENDYMMTDLLYVSSRYQEAIDKANQLLQQQGDKASPRLLKLIAYSYDGLKDSVNALVYINKYFQREKPENYVAKDYELKARLISRQPGSEQDAIALYEKAVALDTLAENKADYLEKAAALFKQTGNRSEEADRLGQVYSLRKNPTNLDIYYWGLAHYAAGEYNQADSVFGIYIEKYPEQLHGYLWRAKSNAIIDSTMEKGLAVPYYSKLIELAGKDSVANKNLLIQAYGYVGAYEANVQKNYAVALENFNKILALDPANTDAARYSDVLKKWMKDEAKEKSTAAQAASR